MKNILFLFIIVSGYTFAQETIITGAIRIDTKMSYIPDVIVTNLRTNESSVTNLFGRFNLKVRLGDELKMMGDNLYNSTIVITENTLQSKNIIITMKPYVDELKEVVVYAYRLTGNLKKDAFLIPFKDATHEINVAMNLPTYYGERKVISYPAYKPTLAEFNKINLDAIYDIFTGNRKKRERLMQWTSRETELSFIRNYFGDTFFIDELKIPAHFIRDFIEFAYESSAIKTYLHNKDYSNIIQSLHLQGTIFRARLATSSQ